jgi:hypothetical protein
MQTGTGGALSVPPDPREGSTSRTGRIGVLSKDPKARHDRKRDGRPAGCDGVAGRRKPPA